MMPYEKGVYRKTSFQHLFLYLTFERIFPCLCQQNTNLCIFVSKQTRTMHNYYFVIHKCTKVQSVWGENRAMQEETQITVIKKVN